MRTVTLYIVRHAQGYHNLSKENEQLPDPDLTDIGKKQCADLRASFHSHAKLTHLVASPLRRTIYTCLESFGPSDDDDDPKRTALLPVIALPEIQEVSEEPCDTGSDVAKLEDEFRGKVDFSRLPAGWNDKSSNSPWEPTVRKLDARARKARVALREMARASKDDACIVAVTHGEFLAFLTGDWSGIHPPEKGLGFTATSWANCEYRSYQFVQHIDSENEEAAIRETEESWCSRRGDEKVPTAEEQAELRRTYIREFGWFIKDDTLPN